MALLERHMTSVKPVDLPEPWRSAALTVVLPTYNEAANLPVIVAALFDLPLTGLRILVADDNSPDGTGDIAEALATRCGRARMSVVHRPGKKGLGRAYTDGMTRAVQAGAEFVVQMDSDLSHGPEYLPQMLGVLLSTEADMVVGSRYIVGATVARQVSPTRMSACCSGSASGMSRPASSSGVARRSKPSTYPASAVTAIASKSR